MVAASGGNPSSAQFRNANPQGESFRPLLELGRGGMARVYLAEKTHRGLRRLVVLKVLEPSLATDAEMRTLFRREAEVCARLHHPNVVQVFEVVDEGAAPFMVMEYVEGVSLSQVLARTEQRLPTRLHVHILMQVLAGLHYFHELRDEEGNPLDGVHRDVSPQNVIVMHEGAAKVLDFGIAKLQGVQHNDVTRAGVIKGKLSYMPPEQLVGDTSIDRRADVFAVGIMLWEAFARRRLWQGWEQQDMIKALVSGTMPPIREACSWISKDMEAIVTKAMATKRDQRYSTALELQMALEGCMGELGGVVQQREIASFMEGEFGEWRRDRQRSVDAEIRKPAVALDTMLEVSEIEEIELGNGTDSSLPHGHVSSNITGSQPRRSRLPIAVALALLSGLLFLGWRLVEQSNSARATGSANAPPLAAQHAAAPPVSGPPPAQPAESAKTEIAPPLAPSASEHAERPRGAKSAPSRRKVVAPAAGAPAPAPAPAAAPPRNCTPPYVLDAEGVKTYKPECL
jgi:eukaryotic-like serine/threonine-protein kinase